VAPIRISVGPVGDDFAICAGVELGATVGADLAQPAKSNPTTKQIPTIDKIFFNYFLLSNAS
jgi:hypothetical protein